MKRAKSAQILTPIYNVPYLIAGSLHWRPWRSRLKIRSYGLKF